MKKLLTFTTAIAILASVATLTACGDPPSENGTGTQNAGAPSSPGGTGIETPPTPDISGLVGAVNGYTFTYRETKIVLGSPIEELFAKIGTPSEADTKREESCAFRGYDYTYTLPGNVWLSTFTPDGVTYHIIGIQIGDDSHETEKGAYMGMSREQITARYGTPTTGAGTHRYHYTKDGMTLEFVFDGADNAIEIFYQFDDAYNYRIDGLGN
ncbi:MAG: hypothetical protein FWD35_05510 [Oscillospiraceae bacterium]|nr:hypothetical protein [Oscillospiraceae bacterium]